MDTIKVRDVMTHLVVMLYPQDTLNEAARRLSRNRISGAPVVEQDRVIGILSESDLIDASTPADVKGHGLSIFEWLPGHPHAARPLGELRVGDVMTGNVATVAPDASVWAAAETMHRRGVKRLPVVDGRGYLIGIVSRGDLIQAMAEAGMALEARSRGGGPLAHEG
jgi:CBS domain-containing protein